MKKFYCYLFISLCSISVAQVGIGTTTPKAALDVTSNTYGTLIVRTSLTSNTDNSTIINPNGGNIAESTLVYNDGLSGLKPSGFYFWSNDKWNCINCKEYGNLKHSFKTSDHNGWYLLDGRSTSSLSTNAQAIATALGLGANLPDATNKVLKGKNTSETLASTVGANSVTLSQSNLPNVNFTGTTSTGGSHTHSGTTSTDGSHSHSYTSRGNTTYNTNAYSSSYGPINPVADNTSGSYSTGSSGNHSHSLNINSAGSHNHTVTVNSGGTNTAIDTTPLSLVTNVFIYLGE